MNVHSYSYESDGSKRGQILGAALRLLSRHGFHGTPMSLVGEEAGVGMGAIYRYFADGKEDLIKQLYLRVKEDMNRAMMAGYGAEVDVRTNFGRIVGSLLEYFLAHPDELSFGEQYANYSPGPPGARSPITPKHSKKRTRRAPHWAPEWEVEGWITSFAATANGEMDVVSDTVARLTGHAPMTLTDFLRRHPGRYRHLLGAQR